MDDRALIELGRARVRDARPAAPRRGGRRHRDPHAARLPGLRRRLPGRDAGAARVPARLLEPARDRPQRPAPLQQPGSLDADGHARGAQRRRRVARRVVGQRRGRVPRGDPRARAGGDRQTPAAAPPVWSRTSCARRSRATTRWRSAAPSASSPRSGSCSRPWHCCCAAARWSAPTCRCSATTSTASTRAGAARRWAPLEAGAGGFALGFVLGRSINWLVDRHEIGIRRRLEYASALDPFGAVDP